MALTRGMLKGMALTDEQVSAIIEEHVSTVDGLKAERDKYKDEVAGIADLKKELADLKADGGSWQEKYEAEHEAFEAFKKDAEAKETTAKVRSAYRALLKESKVLDDHIDSILNVTDFSKMKLDKDGGLAGKDDLVKTIKDKYSGFIPKTEEKGKDPENPPTSTGTGKSKEEILAIKDTTERQRAIAENHELFGF